MTIEQKLNFFDSKRLVEYATGISSTKQVADELNLPEPRVSEMKKGRRKMTHAEAQTLHELYGIPSSDRGVYDEVEIVDMQKSIEVAINKGSLSRHINQIISLFNGYDFQTKLLNTILLKDAEPIKWSGFTVKDDSPETGQELVDGINLLFTQPGFLKWGKFISELTIEEMEGNVLCNSVVYDMDCMDEQTRRKVNFLYGGEVSSDYDSLEGALSNVGLTLYAREQRKLISHNDVIRFYLLWLVVTRFSKDIKPLLQDSHCDEFEFGVKYKLKSPEKTAEEVVIAGEEVWAQSHIELPQALQTKGWFVVPSNNEDVTKDRYEWFPNLKENSGKSIRSESFRFVNLTLFQSKNFNYFVRVTLIGDKFSMAKSYYQEDIDSGEIPFEDVYYGRCRKLLICVPERNKIFNVIDEITEVLGVENIPTDKIKKELSLRGGYIPGAKYFS